MPVGVCTNNMYGAEFFKTSLQLIMKDFKRHLSNIYLSSRRRLRFWRFCFSFVCIFVFYYIFLNFFNFYQFQKYETIWLQKNILKYFQILYIKNRLFIHSFNFIVVIDIRKTVHYLILRVNKFAVSYFVLNNIKQLSALHQQQLKTMSR